MYQEIKRTGKGWMVLSVGDEDEEEETLITQHFQLNLGATGYFRPNVKRETLGA